MLWRAYAVKTRRICHITYLTAAILDEREEQQAISDRSLRILVVATEKYVVGQTSRQVLCYLVNYLERCAHQQC